MELRHCPKCKNDLPVTAFHPSQKRGYCINCINEYVKEYHLQKPFKYLWNRCRTNSNEHKRFNSLTEKDIEDQWYKQKGLCYFSKYPLTFELGEFNKASVDRLDSNIGYTKENIVLCCDAINAMKSVYSINELKFIVDILSEGLKDIIPEKPKKYRLLGLRWKKKRGFPRKVNTRNRKKNNKIYVQNALIFN